MSNRFETFRDPAYDPMLAQAYAFAESLDMRRLAPLDHVTVLRPEHVDRARQHVGQWMPDDATVYGAVYSGLPFDEVLSLDQGDPHDPTAPSTIFLLAGIVHELVHSSLGDLDNDPYHRFVAEAHAGAGEFLYLRLLAKRGVRRLPTIQEIANNSPALGVTVEPEYCYLAEAKRPESSSGLIAFMALRKILALRGMRAEDLLREQRPLEAIEEAINWFDPGLLEIVKRAPTGSQDIVDLSRIMLKATVDHEPRLSRAERACRYAPARWLLRRWPLGTGTQGQFVKLPA